MADHTGIEWTDATWNPVTGCTKVSPGCKNCYAERLAVRLRAMGNPRYRNGFAVTLQPDQIELPLRWRRPRRIFVNSMSDLFHELVPEEYIQQVFEVMARAHWHVFQILTSCSSSPVRSASAAISESSSRRSRARWTPSGVARTGASCHLPGSLRGSACQPLRSTPWTGHGFRVSGKRWPGSASGRRTRAIHASATRRTHRCTTSSSSRATRPDSRSGGTSRRSSPQVSEACQGCDGAG
jgi:protein gp37